MNKSIKVMWVDQEHIVAWQGYIDLLSHYDVQIFQLKTSDIRYILQGCKGKDFFVYHCGTYIPAKDLVSNLKKIVKTYPKLKIYLQSNVEHNGTEKLVNGIITNNDQLLDLLRIFYANDELYEEDIAKLRVD
jgi:hypothetical protein